MPLTLVTGPANAGKTGLLHGELRTAVAESRPAFLIVPSGADARRTEREFARDMPVGVKAETPLRFLERLWSQYGDGRRIVSSVTRTALVERASSTVPLERVGDTPGLRRLLATIASQTNRAPAPGADDRIGREVAAILARYRDELRGEGLVEPVEAAALLAHEPPRLDATVAWNRFTDLSEWQVELARGLASRNRVLLALSYEPDAPATAATAALVTHLEAAGAEIVAVEGPRDSTELEQLSSSLYRGVAAISSGGEVALGEASGLEAETALIAEIAAEEVRRVGGRAERVAVVFRDPTSRAALVRGAFTAEGVPAELTMEQRLGRTGLGGAVAALVQAARGVGGREDVIALLQSPYAGPVRSSMEELDTRWRRSRRDDPSLMLDDVGLVNAWATELVRTARTVRGVVTPDVGDAWKKLARMLAAAAASERGDDLDDVHTRDDLTALTAIGTLVDDLVDLPDRLDVASALAVFDSQEVRFGVEDRPGAVQITSLRRLRSRRFDVVIIGGLTDDELSTRGDMPAWSKLAERLGLTAGSDRALVDRLLFYLAVSRARERLWLVRQTTDERGEARAPSVLLDEVRACYTDASELEVRRIGLDSLARAMPSLQTGRSSLRARVENGECAPARPSRGSIGTGVLADRRDGEVYSASELQTYLECPRRWLFERVLRPRDLDRVFDAAELGSLSHLLLSRCFKAMAEHGLHRVTASNLPTVLELFEEAVTASLDDPHCLRPRTLAEEQGRSRAIAVARKTLIADAALLPGFEVLATERSFGGEGEPEVEVAGIRFRGRIDRVDRGSDGLVLTDYKLGSVSGMHAEAFARKNLVQMPVYAAAGEAIWSEPVRAGIYRSLSTGSMSGFWSLADPPPRLERRAVVDGPEGMDRMREQAEEMVTRAVEGIRAGVVVAASGSWCEYCRMRGVCEERR